VFFEATRRGKSIIGGREMIFGCGEKMGGDEEESRRLREIVKIAGKFDEN
jgi:hypothetical protein